MGGDGEALAEPTGPLALVLHFPWALNALQLVAVRLAGTCTCHCQNSDAHGTDTQRNISSCPTTASPSSPQFGTGVNL